MMKFASRAARLTAVVSVLVPYAAMAADVSVSLEGVKGDKGTLVAYLQTEAQYLKPVGAFQASVPAKPGAVTILFRDVPAGEYALAVVHDLNGNNNMDMNPGGIPAEGWGTFKPEAVTGPPTFDSQKMVIGDADAELKAGMIYYGGAPQ